MILERMKAFQVVDEFSDHLFAVAYTSMCDLPLRRVDSATLPKAARYER
jgi:hypothetical protein